MGKRRTRKKYEAAFKARVALAAARGDKTTSELASEFGVHGNLVSQWKRRLLAGVPRVFEEPDEPQNEVQQELIDELHLEACHGRYSTDELIESMGHMLDLALGFERLEETEPNPFHTMPPPAAEGRGS